MPSHSPPPVKNNALPGRATSNAPAQPQAVPRVTIVTMVCEAASPLLRTAPSILGQSLQDWEWLIIIDGRSSDPESIEVLSRCRDLDPRIRVVDHAPGDGAVAAR